jgi:hypothetical protein
MGGWNWNGSYHDGLSFIWELAVPGHALLWLSVVKWKRKGEYGTTHWLSTSMSPFCICMVANLPPSSADLLLCKGHVILSKQHTRAWKKVSNARRVGQ